FQVSMLRQASCQWNETRMPALGRGDVTFPLRPFHAEFTTSIWRSSPHVRCCSVSALLVKPLQQRSFVNKQATTDARHAWNLIELDQLRLGDFPTFSRCLGTWDTDTLLFEFTFTRERVQIQRWRHPVHGRRQAARPRVPSAERVTPH